MINWIESYRHKTIQAYMLQSQCHLELGRYKWMDLELFVNSSIYIKTILAKRYKVLQMLITGQKDCYEPWNMVSSKWLSYLARTNACLTLTWYPLGGWENILDSCTVNTYLHQYIAYMPDVYIIYVRLDIVKYWHLTICAQIVLLIYSSTFACVCLTYEWLLCFRSIQHDDQRLFLHCIK